VAGGAREEALAPFAEVVEFVENVGEALPAA
jgi:hypothetical protein